MGIHIIYKVFRKKAFRIRINWIAFIILEYKNLNYIYWNISYEPYKIKHIFPNITAFQ